MMTRKKKTLLILAVVLVVVVCLSGVYFHYENNTLQVTRYQIVSENLPGEFNDFKLVQISDFHNTKSKKLTNALVKNLQKQAPDIIVITGDFVDANRTDINVAIKFVQKIKAIAPIYYVTGNHEAKINQYGKYAQLKTGLLENGVVVLDEQVAVIEMGGVQINLLGINDPTMSRDEAFSDKEIINNRINRIEYEKTNFSILLSHRPEVLDVYAANEIDVVLTGHAHGGQIRLPWIGGLYAPNQGVLPKYTSGTFQKEKTTMIVSRGIGNSTFPFRVNNRPELVVLTLKNN